MWPRYEANCKEKQKQEEDGRPEGTANGAREREREREERVTGSGNLPLTFQFLFWLLVWLCPLHNQNDPTKHRGTLTSLLSWQHIMLHVLEVA